MNDKIQDIFALIEQDHPRVIDLSLDRLIPLLEKLGNPHKKLPPVVHVAGTNGKGSVCAFLRTILSAMGLRVLTYTSPHLIRFNERFINVDGYPIDDDTLYESLVATRRANEESYPVTLFEITTAATFHMFSKIPADVVILETGLGGRLDATNVIENPAVTAITRVGLDHMEFLGDTVEKIVREKVGISKKGAPMVVGNQHDHTKNLILNNLSELGIESFAIQDSVVISTSPSSWTYKDFFGCYELPLPSLKGGHQIENASIAIAISHILYDRGLLNFDKALSLEHIVYSMENTHWPARLQKLELKAPFDKLSNEWTLILDGGHNKDAGFSIARFIREYQAHNYPQQPCHLLIGMLLQKDVLSFIRPLDPLVASIHTITIPNTSSSHTAYSLAEAALSVGISARPTTSLSHAVELLSRLKPGILVISGSLYLAGYIFQQMEIDPYQRKT